MAKIVAGSATIVAETIEVEPEPEEAIPNVDEKRGERKKMSQSEKIETISQSFLFIYFFLNIIRKVLIPFQV